MGNDDEDLISFDGPWWFSGGRCDDAEFSINAAQMRLFFHPGTNSNSSRQPPPYPLSAFGPS